MCVEVKGWKSVDRELLGTPSRGALSRFDGQPRPQRTRSSSRDVARSGCRDHRRPGATCGESLREEHDSMTLLGEIAAQRPQPSRRSCYMVTTLQFQRGRSPDGKGGLAAELQRRKPTAAPRSPADAGMHLRSERPIPDVGNQDGNRL